MFYFVCPPFPTFPQENKCMIFSFYVSLLVLFIGVVVSATIAFTQSIDVLRAPLIRSLSEYEANSTDPDRAEVAATWDDLQIKVRERKLGDAI